jgi:hypothetical protein
MSSASVAVIVYVVVSAGETEVSVELVTSPTSLSILIAVAPVISQDRVTLSPALMLVAEAENEATFGPPNPNAARSAS